MPTPRVFIVRHGETAWSLSGRHTGTSDIPLTPAGERRIRATGAALVGPDRLIVPRALAHVYVSPRARAQRTLALLMGAQLGAACRVETAAAVAEWDYGDYEGLTSREIAAQRREAGEKPWEIWRDGCPGGESPADVTARLDTLIADLRARFHAPVMAPSPAASADTPRDVLIVAHGHILRALAARWVGKPLPENPSLLLEAGGVGTLSYEHESIEEPAILLGGAFVVEVLEGEEGEKGEA